jgi:DNA (cytosine-5)-methyltransferase 1
MNKTVVELFAGVGGFRVALNDVFLNENNETIEKMNFDFVWTNQWEPNKKTQYAFNCYTRRFGIQNEESNTDITTVNKNKIPNHTLLVGGFPCQDYSVARGISGEKGIQGKKGVLWWQIVDVIKNKLPSFLLLENVDRLLKSPSFQRGRDFSIMLKSLMDYGYGIEWRVINAASYGHVQRRKRLYIFAFKKESKYYQNFSQKYLLLKYDILQKEGLFCKPFPIQDNPTQLVNSCSFEEKDIVDLSNNFSTNYYNAGFAIDNQIFSAQFIEKEFEKTPLDSILSTNPVEEEFFLTDEQVSKVKVYLELSMEQVIITQREGLHFQMIYLVQLEQC